MEFRGRIFGEDCRRPPRVRRHERVRGLPTCLGAAVPGQRLAGRLGGRRQSELSETQTKSEWRSDNEIRAIILSQEDVALVYTQGVESI